MAPMLETILKSRVGTSKIEDLGGAAVRVTISEVTKKVQRRGISEVPHSLVVPENCRPKMRHDQFGDVPVIDLSKSVAERARLSQKVGDAASDWGAFQVINHGIPRIILQQMEGHGKQFFDRPVERKMELVKGVHPRAYYTGNNSEEKWHSLHWAESYVQLWNKWDHMDHMSDEQVDLLYPGGNDPYKLLVSQFMEGIRSTSELILQLLAEYLGLESRFFSKGCLSNGTLVTRWNYYPLCPAPEITLGAHEHTDPNFLSILYQDITGGLQVKRGGEWSGVRPIAGALVIIIADCLHIISNGYFKTAVHQAVVNEHSHRLSLVCALYLENEADLSAPDKLVNNQHPRLYQKIFSWEYWNLILRKREGSLQSEGKALNGLNILNDIKIPVGERNA